VVVSVMGKTLGQAAASDPAWGVYVRQVIAADARFEQRGTSGDPERLAGCTLIAPQGETSQQLLGDTRQNLLSWIDCRAFGRSA
jgi:hypothetical protein